MTNELIDNIILSNVPVTVVDGITVAPISPLNITLSLGGNAQYFGHEEWGRGYLEACHRDPAFIDRWKHATGSWDNKVVVDIGCGPGNVFASLGGTPSLLVGVDVSFGALKMAKNIGYTPLLADAQDLPLRSGFADIVVINAIMHHADNMELVLSEAARLVKPGGVLVSDHDVQLTAVDFKGLGYQLWQLRLFIYRLMKRGGHASELEQRCAVASEAHHACGDGVDVAMYHSILEPLEFDVDVYPHNNSMGAEIFDGKMGKANFKYRLAQRLSGIVPGTPSAALSLMCVAHKK